LGGIIFDVWAEKLTAAKIIETSSDLYIPAKNIRSTGFILRTIINDEISKAKDGLIVQRVITKYYGAASPAYEKTMKEVTSRLWLKRISRELERSLPSKPESAKIQE
jgi:hypothetical protein